MRADELAELTWEPRAALVEERPARSALARLSADEAELHGDLVGDVLGAKVRLEQERIDWGWAQARLGAAPWIAADRADRDTIRP